MNLLDKFSAVDIKAETRISNSDKQFCEVQQAAYNHGRNALKQILDISERFIKEQNDILGAIDREVYSNYIYDGREGVSLHSIHELLRKSHRTFISKIVSHFSSAYHVELDSSAVVDNLVPHEPRYSNEKDAKEYTEQIENMDVSYDQVLDQIFVQLGGFSFHDKAINEMKEKCHEAAWNKFTYRFSSKNRTAFPSPSQRVLKSLSYLLLDMDALLTAGMNSGTRANMKSN